MSTLPNYLIEDDTSKIDSYGVQDTYLQGKSGTDPTASDEPEIRPRSRILRGIELIPYHECKIEVIKQKWNGTVIEFDNNDLTVRLEDASNPENSEEFVTFAIEEIEKRDQPLIQFGAMLVWHIGYRYGPKYPRERFSKITFRRLAKWTEEEIQNAEALAKEYTDFFSSDST